MHLSASGGIWTRPEISRFLVIFRQILMIFGYFWTLGANYYAEIRVQGLTISGANYSEPPLDSVTVEAEVFRQAK